MEWAWATGLSPLSNGNVSFTSSGFGTYDWYAVFVSGANSTNNPEALGQLGIGASDGTTQFAVGGAQEDNLTDSNTERSQSTSAVIYIPDLAASTRLIAAHNAQVTDGVQLAFSDVDATFQYYIAVLLVKGCANFNLRALSLPAATASGSVTDLSWKPNGLFAFTSWIGLSPPNVTANVRNSFGWAHNSSTDTLTQISIGYNYPDTVTADYVGVGIHNDRILDWSNYQDNTRYLTLSNFDANGYDWTLSSAISAGALVFMVEFDSGDTDGFYVGIVDSPTGSTWNCEDVGFELQSAFLGFTPCTVVGTYIGSADPACIGIGYTDGTIEGCIACDNDAAAATTDQQSNYSASNMISLYQYSGGHVKLIEGAFDSFDSLGINASISTTYGTALKWMLVGPRAAAGGGTALATRVNIEYNRTVNG